MCQLVALVLRDLRVLVERLTAAGGLSSPVAAGTRRRLMGVVEISSSRSSSLLLRRSIISCALGVLVMRRVHAGAKLRVRRHGDGALHREQLAGGCGHLI